MKIRLLIGGPILLLMVTVGIVLWHSHYRDALPRIKDADLLRNECVLLCQQFPLRELNTNHMMIIDGKILFRGRLGQERSTEIPKQNWPASIQALHPFNVTRDEYAVCTWIKNNTRMGVSTSDPRIFARNNWDWKGYYVHTNPLESPPRSATHGSALYYLDETKFDGIDQFIEPDAVR